jgi:coenzyme PQQ precursor peptide PqqA
MERAFRPLSLLMPPPRRSAERIVHCAAHRPERDFTWPRAQPGKGLIIIRGGVAALRGRLARRPAPAYLVFRNSREDDKMAWTTPTLIEICVGLEINGYLPAEF